MRVRCALYVEVTEEADLQALDWAALPQPVLVMGGGSNLLFTRDFPGTVLHCGMRFTRPSGPRNDKDVIPSTSPVISSDPSFVIPSEPSSVIPSERSEASVSPLLVTCGAGVVFDDFCAWAASEGLWGPENLSLIPGEVGASAVQNIGAYGIEAKDIIAAIRAYDRTTGQFVTIDPADCAYGYRASKFKTEWKGRYVITAVTYRLSRTPQPRLDYGGVRKALEESGKVPVPGTCPPPDMGRGRGPFPKGMRGAGTERSEVEFPGTGTFSLAPADIREAIIGIRRKKLPAVEEMGSAGSFFCNPIISRAHFQRIEATAKADNGPDYQVPHYEVGNSIKVPAAWMIEQCGFKGARNGGAQVYQNQPLVIVNASGTALPEEVIGLEQQIIQRIEAKYGITLHPEVEHV